MPINVSEAIDSDTAEKMIVERTTGSGYVDGLWVKGTITTFKTLASAQQPTPKQLETLPEGDRARDPFLFISKKPLLAADDKTNTAADLVTFKGQKYKIIKVGDWSSYGHTMAFGVRDQ